MAQNVGLVGTQLDRLIALARFGIAQSGFHPENRIGNQAQHRLFRLTQLIQFALQGIGHV